ncbi:toll/interleukin-1 receptor domain-containing protein [Aquabacterium humicola]|uniref:toll/interleukin-1 receptor domain-containing protein n=1 Tax=Aquabacterium humicola TaxID=3237377 RepID=UPI00254373D7|nr:toll/interleukin-1 receptor domain-containing protein [Rubrivivax pictus]
MARLFISYAHDDRPLARALAAALAQDGHEVWWDRQLATAGPFRLQIQQALDAADLVLVLWTARSRVSTFVADEADIALSRGRLLSLLVEGARPALGFGALHGIALAQGIDPDDDDTFRSLRTEVARRLASGPQALPKRPAVRVMAAGGALSGLTAIGFGLAQGAGQALATSPGAALGFGLEHAAYAFVLSMPPAAFAAVRSRRFGLGRFRAVARPYLRTLAAGLVVALIFGAGALAAGADAGLAPQARAWQLASIVLFATLVAAAAVGAVRLALLMASGRND